MTAEEMANCAAGGRYWYMRADGTFYGIPEQTPENPSDIYLLDAPPEWIEQWESWEQAVDEMSPMFAQLNALRET